MLDIYICEDNEQQRAFAASFISGYCAIGGLDAAVALATHSPEDILRHWSGLNPALFFLDIDLRAGMNGIELARRIRERGQSVPKVFIVFLTTHTEMTMLTFQYKVEALDFIAKDNPDNIKKKIGECIDVALRRHTANGSSKTVKINVDDKVVFLDMDEIIYIETTHVRHKLRLHTKSRVLEFNAELKAMGERLDGRFVRCHKSYLINRDKIAAIDKRGNTVKMVNNSTCSISRNAKKLLCTT